MLLPSQWLSILLRYINRTSDDFKSFVSFLNLSQNESNITNEKLQLILVGISEITQDFEKQSSIIEVMIENRFKGILEKNDTEDEIIEKSKAFAKSKLEADLDQVKEHYSVLADSLDAHIKGTGAALHEMQIEKQQEIDKNKTVVLENRQLKNELRKDYILKKLYWWKFLAYCLIPVFLLFIAFYAMIFCVKNWEFNYSHKLIIWIDSLPKDGMEHEILKEWVINILGIGSIGLIGNLIWIRLFDKSKIAKKIESIEATIPSKYL